MSPLPRSFTDHLALWFRHRWFLVKVFFLAALATAVISSLIPKTYRATAMVLPPFDGGTALPFLGGVTVDVFGANEVSAAGLATLLKSRALKDRVQSHIDLKEHYQKPDLERAYKAFENSLEIEMESEESFGAVSIIAFRLHVLDRDPEFAARLVNVVVEEWDRLTVDLNRRSASLRRQFTEENLRANTLELAATEDSLRRFQEQYGIASVEAQVEGTVTSGFLLEQRIIEARTEVQVLEKMLRSNHPELKRAHSMLQGLQEEQKRMRVAGETEGLMLPLNVAPEIGLQYARLFRSLTTLETIHAVLVQQYEQARMQELKDMPSLRLVDTGEVPLYKYKPKRALMVLMASFSALFLAVLVMYFNHYRMVARGTPETGWLDEITAGLKTDLGRLARPFTRRKAG